MYLWHCSYVYEAERGGGVAGAARSGSGRDNGMNRGDIYRQLIGFDCH